ncbi:MAG: hypothetical protein L0287_18190, partial [Anaerolineae bacterium]|nr:hypothetical protein [Anaerolineae bacterium]
VRGRAQLVLLRSIFSSRRSVAANRRLAEWNRKFGELQVKVQKPKSLKFRKGTSAINEVAANKMTDEQWLRAIAKHNREYTRFRQDGKYVHGADDWSKLLENQVKKNPERFAILMLQFPTDTHQNYFQAVLRGITDANLDVQIVLQACQRCHQLSNKPCSRWICQPISKLAKLPLPNDALEIVTWYATQDPDPSQESWRTKTPGGEYYHENDQNYFHEVLIEGINSVRGVAAEAVGELIFYDGNRIPYFLKTLQALVRDPSIAVRSCVAETLTAVLKHDRELATSLFQQLCDADEILLGTPHIERFLLYALQTHFEVLESILQRMITSELPEVAMAGARQACLASLDNEQARPFAQLCLSGTDTQRLGAAQVFSANLHQTHFRLFCEEALKQLFNDPNEKVRTETAKCFHNFEGEELSDHVNLIESFIQSSAFTTDHFYLFYALENTTAKLPDVTCLVCERFLDAVGQEVADTRTHSAVDANTVSQLLVRVYSQSKNETIRTRCLDLIDRMTRMEVYGLKEVLERYDR